MSYFGRTENCEQSNKKYLTLPKQTYRHCRVFGCNPESMESIISGTYNRELFIAEQSQYERSQLNP